ncbi:hypothetical protein B5807_05085 [Epicoccum nigrum]|uniref:Uncharacterized protein n=1 Tax=Epicoccum nigrum TaxID=105696 RepID=A0A1Y2M1W3_EPING|nr:hypothetical protein B5807_05085 [Epicoccum nigrum]
MCGRAYYVDGHRYFSSYPRSHPLTIRSDKYGRRIKAASPSPEIKREETPEMKRGSSPSPEPSSPWPLPWPLSSPPAHPLKRRLYSPPSDLQSPATKKLKHDGEVAKPLRARSLTPWGPIHGILQPSLEGENEKLRLDIEDLRTEKNIQEQLNEALKEENAAAVAYTKTLEDQVRGLKNIVRGLREQRRGLTGESE